MSGAKLSGAKLSGAKLSYNLVRWSGGQVVRWSSDQVIRVDRVASLGDMLSENIWFHALNIK